ncbi:hypothetical protein B5K06_25735 [Rhizobium grahamii]|uniref:Uncharacterized protein n=1 Tax=Rhizobium grahamii TaxID=1120045 RepID=A0A370KIV2_9HYPH|nr:hypothetical protein B5K06_25735 [Rhizobium grahamii]
MGMPTYFRPVTVRHLMVICSVGGKRYFAPEADMQDASYDRFRYGLALLLVRRPYLRCYREIAHWWPDAVEEYAVAIKARDKLRSDGDNEGLLQEYEARCLELEEELEGYLTAAGTGG